MRPILALVLTAGLALAAPGWAAPPQGKPVTAGEKVGEEEVSHVALVSAKTG